MPMRITPAIPALAALLSLTPSAASAQAGACRVPPVVARPHIVGPSADEPRRVVPVAGYTLAVSWSPEYCHGRRGAERDAFQCGGAGRRFGFTLHGLWPDGRGTQWPQYCRPAALLPDAVIRANLCATPSPQLLQHEYAKHGTCTGLPPADYFRLSTGLYAALRFPDMGALAGRRPNAGQLAREVARVNPGMTADMMRISVNRRGWLQEIWFCLDRARRYTRCPAGAGGAPAGASVKIQQPGA